MAWLTGWPKRIPITIDPTTISGGGLSEDLTNFPMLITLSSGTGRNSTNTTSIFDELGDSSKKIAMTTSDGTQCFIEIEEWDSANKTASLWMKASQISASENTTLYLYYGVSQSDNTSYVGDVGDVPAQNVWDDNFAGVWHMNLEEVEFIEDFSSDPSWTIDIDQSSTFEYNGVDDRWDWSCHCPSSSSYHDWCYGQMCGLPMDETFDWELKFKFRVTAASGWGMARLGLFGEYKVAAEAPMGIFMGLRSRTNGFRFTVSTDQSVETVSNGTYSNDTDYYVKIWTTGNGTYYMKVWDDDWDGSSLVSDCTNIQEGKTFLAGNFGIAAYREEYGTTRYIDGWLDDITLTGPSTNLDSTSNNNNGSSAGGMGSSDVVDGKIAKALDFDGSDDYVKCGSAASLDDIDVKTVEFTFKADAWGEGNAGRVIQKANTNANGWNIFLNGLEGYKNLGYMRSWDESLGIWYIPEDSISLSTWYAGAIIYDRTDISNNPIMYLDGISVSGTETSTPAGSIESDAEEHMWIGARNYAGSDREFDGIIDEIRISNIARSEDWIKTTYQSNEDDLIVLSSIQYEPYYSPDTQDVIYENPYYNASSSGIEIYNTDISTTNPIAYATWAGGINSATLMNDILYMGTSSSGIIALPTSSVSGTDIYNIQDVYEYIYPFKDYPDITDSHVKYLHSGGDYMCVVTNVGVDHFNFGGSDSYYRSYATISGVEKCWQTSAGRFYYTMNTSEPYTQYIYDEDFSADPGFSTHIDGLSVFTHVTASGWYEGDIYQRANASEYDLSYHSLGTTITETSTWQLKCKFYLDWMHANERPMPRIGIGGGTFNVAQENIPGVQVTFRKLGTDKCVLNTFSATGSWDEDASGTINFDIWYYIRMWGTGDKNYHCRIATGNYDDEGGSTQFSMDETEATAATFSADKFVFYPWSGGYYGTTEHAECIIDDITLGPTESGTIYTGNLYSIYTHQCDWDENSIGYRYQTSGAENLFFPEQVEINDIAVTEGTSIHTTGKGNTNNVLLIATTSGITLIEEKQGDEENSRYKQYTTASGSILKGDSNNFVAITSEYDSTFDSPSFAAASYGSGAGLNVIYNDELKLFWPSTVSGTGNTIRQDASDLTSVR